MKQFIEKNKRSILYWAIAAVVFSLLLMGMIFCRQSRSAKRQPADIITVGDSLLGQDRGDTSVAALLSRMSNRSVINGNLSGTTIAKVDLNRTGSNVYELYSMSSLVKSIVAKDFGIQSTQRRWLPGTGNYEEVIRELAAVDFAKTNVLFICYGVNDYHGGVPLDNEKDPYDEYAYAGAIRYVVRNLKKHYPDLRIILMTPTYTWYPDREVTCENMKMGEGYVLEDYVNTMLDTARELGVESLDIYHDFYDHDSMDDWSVYTVDGIHPNEAGREKIARAMADYLKENP